MGTTRWLSWQEMGLDEALALIWRNDTDALSTYLVNLTDQKDSLIWSFNPS